ncbi:unnamed protein product [Adineta ricciae]|uniref:Uncharacterized protein n=1 Tax=Adineta ricciae TaxID=249248 RepID=A0A814FMU7_ADIRI|nr:unnamed protein product [Adineta ricciae]CAF1077113.1 unnamed protein product [Adineta ricciae]
MARNIMADESSELYTAIRGLQLYRRECRRTIAQRTGQGRSNGTTDNGEICLCQQPGEQSEIDERDHMNSVEINEQDYGPKKLSSNEPRYIRCDINTPPEKIEKLLTEIWKVERPKLLVAVIGGAKYFKMSEGLEEKFCSKIIDATRQSGAWLLTSGFNAGVVQMIGRTLNNMHLTSLTQHITAIAVTKYGCIRNNSDIVQKIDPQAKEYEESTRKGKHDLEPNHSHYILLDDGTRHQYRGIQDRLSVFMRTISKGKNMERDSSRNLNRSGLDTSNQVPAVTLLVEGGKDSIISVYHSLKNNIPVIIVKGSGRAADFFARWIYILDKKESSSMNSNQRKILRIDSDSDRKQLDGLVKPYEKNMRVDLRRTLTHHSEEPWQWDDQERLKKNVDKIWYNVLFCLQPSMRSNLFQFHLAANDDLTNTLLRTIYRVRRKTIDSVHSQNSADRNAVDKRNLDVQMLRLALQWNCLEVAKDLIVRGSIENINLKEQADDLLLTLSNNLPAFLHYFITLGLALPRLIFRVDSDVRTITSRTYNQIMIAKLYSQDVIEDFHKKGECLLYDIMDLNGHFRQQLSTKDLNHVLNELVGYFMEKLYPEDGNTDHAITNSVGVDVEVGQSNSNELSNYAIRDLFIWSILMSKIDMAKMLLAHINHRICAALVARKILMTYRTRYVKYSDRSSEYEAFMNYFEEYAIKCITQCYKNNSNKARKLVLRECKMFGNVTCLQVAFHAKAKRFIDHSCCVQAISNVWYRSIDIDRTGVCWLLVHVFTFGLTTIFTNIASQATENTYVQANGINTDVESKSALEPYGITYSDALERRQVQSKSSCKPLSINLANILEFHQCPVVKFSYDCIHYLLIVLLFSYVQLFRFDPLTMQTSSIHWTEILLVILISCMLISAFRLFFELDTTTKFATIKHYHSHPVKTYSSILSYVLFYTGFGLRFTLTEPQGNFFYARIIMGYSLQLWWLRALKYVGTIEFFGPPIVAIEKMLHDLVFFACLIIIVMCGYGTASRSIAYYGNITFTADEISREIAYPVYYLLYGQLDNELKYLDSAPGTNWSVAVHILLAFNMLFMVILLLNLLIAMFNKRFDKIYDEAMIIWHYQQYKLVRDYFGRACLLPPVSLVIDTYNLLGIFIDRMFGRKYCPECYRKKIFKMITKNRAVKKSWDAFEGASTYEYAKAEAPIGTTTTAENMADSQEILDEKFHDLLKSVEDEQKTLKSSFDEFQTLAKSSLHVIETKLANVHDSEKTTTTN